MTIQDTPLRDAKLIRLPKAADDRGFFIKSFHETTLAAAGIHFQLKESYFSLSHKDVIRGMHFQTPPHQHAKIVFCPQGAILDVIVDLRKDSATYGRHFAQELSADNALALYIPEGFAHGFTALQNDSLTYYLVTSEYHRDSDTGIRYDSIGFDWGIEAPILSDRDRSFSTLADFRSPFQSCCVALPPGPVGR